MLEKVLKFSIENRVLIILLTIAAAMFGAQALQRLPIDAVPDITNNQVQINIVANGLSTEEVEKQVTFPIETALAGIPGLHHTRSISRNAFSQVTAVFEDRVDIFFARQQISERLTEARESLPPGSEPRMGPIATGLGEVYMWTVRYEHPEGKGALVKDGSAGWQSDGSFRTPDGEKLRNDVERASYLRTVQDWIIRPQLKGLPGIAGIDAIGGYVKQYMVQPDPWKLVSFDITFQEVKEAIERNNVSKGAGYIETQGEAYVVRADGRIATLDAIGRIVIGSREGTPLLVRDIATVGIGKELRTGSASQSGAEVVVGTAIMRIGENSRTVAVAVDGKMAEIRKSLPPGIVAEAVLNRTKLVDATIGTVGKNLAEGALLVIVVLFVLLGNFRAAFLTALAIPLSMLFTAIGMVESRISGNLMSLGAIDFGLIVDGAVIIVENCMRVLAEKQHELGRPLTLRERLDVVLRGSQQVRQATAFGEAIIITVYIPILALTGVEGKMFHPMAYTVIFALASAFVLSLTFIPAMVAILMRGRIKEGEMFLIRWAKAAYEPVVRFAVGNRRSVLAGGVLAFCISLLFFLGLGQEFVPTLDEKDIAMHAMRIPSTSMTKSTEMQLQLEREISEMKEVAFIFSKTGTAEMASDPMPPNVSDTFVIFKPREEWPDPALPKLGLIQKIETALGHYPGQSYEFTQPIQMRFNELIAGVRGDVAIKVYGDAFGDMDRTANEIATALRKIPGAADVKVEQTQGLPTMSVDIDRGAISRLGLSIADVQQVVSIAVGGEPAGLVFEGDRRFQIVVRLPDSLRADQDVIANLPVPLPRHEGTTPATVADLAEERAAPRRPFVPLREVARIEVVEGLNQVSRENGKRRIVVQCNVRGRDLAGFVEDAQAAIATGVKIPPGQWLVWGGQFENLVAARHRLMIVVPVCLFLIFLLLYSTFHSLKPAILVFTGVPLALTGGILALYYRGIPFSISAAVGFIALSGVAVLNGLVMVTFINQLRKEGTGLDDAIIGGSLTRLRPVLMTALVASLGFLPMALATGTGAEVQRPLATVVIGGLVSSTLLTLVLLPALYRMFEGSESERSPA